MKAKRERHWIILAEDGRHVTLGRHTDPPKAEVDLAGESLRKLGIGGWLAVLDGTYYQMEDQVSLLMVRIVSPNAGVTWEYAEGAFLRIRQDAARAN